MLSMLKVTTKTEVSDFRRSNFSLLTVQLGEILWETSTESNGNKLNAVSWKHKTSSSPFKSREVDRARDPSGLTAKLLSLLTGKREVYQWQKST